MSQKRPHVFEGLLTPAFRCERIGDAERAVAKRIHELPDKPVRGIQIDHAEQFRFRGGGENVVDLPVDMFEFIGVEIEPVRRILPVRLAERVGRVGGEHAEFADSGVVKTFDRIQFFPERTIGEKRFLKSHEKSFHAFMICPMLRTGRQRRERVRH